MAVRVSVAFLLILSVVQASEPRIGECRQFWTRFGNNCYRFFGTLKTWQNAESHCREIFNRSGHQGHLASVRNQKENKFLQKLWSSSLVPYGGRTGDQVWIGLNDIKEEGRFVFSDGSDVSFTQWNTNQPDNAGREDCVQFAVYPHGTAWNDQNCDLALPHICELYYV